jgi:large subunit ribosomal protein L9
MKVILLQRVAKLGQMGEIVNVKDGFGRNFLLPQGKALRANDANIKSFEARKVQLEAQNLETKKEADAIAATLDGQVFVIIRSASDAGALYGSVTTRDAADAATEAGFTVDRNQVALDKPIKELGLHTVSVVLHPEVTAQIHSGIGSRSRSRSRVRNRRIVRRNGRCKRGRRGHGPRLIAACLFGSKEPRRGIPCAVFLCFGFYASLLADYSGVICPPCLAKTLTILAKQTLNTSLTAPPS